MRGTGAVAGAWGAVVGVAVVADELDRRDERAGRTCARATAPRGPAKVAGEASGGGVPDLLGDAAGGDEVDGGAVAVGVVAGLAGGRHTQAVVVRDPGHVVVEAGVDQHRAARAGERPCRQRPVGPR